MNATATSNSVEEQILRLLAAPVDNATQIQALLRQLAESAGADKADACAELWQEELMKTRHDELLLELLAWRATLRHDREFAGYVFETLSDYFRTVPQQQALLRHAGFADKDVAPEEALRRFQRLRRMKPGMACYEKTWGGGLIREINDFLGQLVVDFQHKPNHRMALAYAAANLELLPPENILARRITDPAAVAREIAETPEVIVREVIRHFGPFTVARLQTWITAHLIAEADWKSFWEAARKKLKNDPTLTIPTRRTDPIIFREQTQTHDANWQSAFAQERDPEKIVETAEKLVAAHQTSDAALSATVAERLAFVLRYAAKRQQLERSQALLLLDTLAAPDAYAGERRQAAAEFLADPAQLAELFTKLPSRARASFIHALARLQPETWHSVLPQCLKDLPASAINEIIAAVDEPALVFKHLKALLQQPQPPLEIAAWACKNTALCEQYDLITRGRLVATMLNLLAAPAKPGEARARNQIQDCLTDSQWLADACRAMDEAQRKDLALRLKGKLVGLENCNTAILVQLIKIHPELEDVLREPAPAAAPALPRITSQRTYRARQMQLHKLINEEIPANSREIALARSYGDLRENFEYKSAKDAQGLLMRRRMEWEQMLAEVHPSDFANFSTAHAGPGTTVTLRYRDGAAEIYSILGEWDYDENLRIISCRSPLAQILNGKRAGETVHVPSADGGTREAVIAEIAGLPPEVRAWIAAEPSVENAKDTLNEKSHATA